MKIIKLSAIDSTNSYLTELSKNMPIEDNLIVTTKRQTKGRGQMGAHWESSNSKSLTFSMFKCHNGLLIKDQSQITFAVSLGLKRAMEKFQVPDISIKWPNDIMSYQKKLAGILIENQTKGKFIKSSVIGIGINVNETEFDSLPLATSMFLNSGLNYNIDEVLHCVCETIIELLERVIQKDFPYLQNEYTTSLFRKDIVSTFENSQGNQFNGIIRGVSDLGELLLETEDGSILEYQLKQLKMCY